MSTTLSIYLSESPDHPATLMVTGTPAVDVTGVCNPLNPPTPPSTHPSPAPSHS